MSAKDNPKCPTCGGDGLDKAHSHPDGAKAHCETCHGYGTLSDNVQEILQSIVADVNAMRCHGEDVSEEEEANDPAGHFFGLFSTFTLDGRIEWPNLSILIQQAEKVLAKGQP